jgi:hypothetical protein
MEDATLEYMKAPSMEKTTRYEEAIKKTLYFSLLEKIPSQQIPLDMTTMQLTILELSDDHSHELENRNSLVNLIQTTFRLLIKGKSWKPEYATNFFGKLHRLNALNAGQKNTKIIQEVVDVGLAAMFLSDKTEKFMDNITFKRFDRISEIVMNINGNNFDKAKLDKKTLDAIAEIAMEFFTKSVQKSSEGMNALSNTFMGVPIYNSPFLSFIVPVVGIGEFKDMTFIIRHILQDGLRQYLLKFVEKARKNSSEITSSMQVIEKAIEISGNKYTVSFGWVVQQKKILIKGITVSLDPPRDSSNDSANDEAEMGYQDPYFFGETVLAPAAPPNPYTPFYSHPLYTIRQVPNSTYSVLEVVPEEMRNEVIRMINKDIKDEVNEKLNEKYPIGCEMHTVMKPEGAPVHVATFLQSGLHLSVRALDGNVRTFLKPLEDSAKRKRVYDAIVASHVFVANVHFSNWHRVDSLRPLIDSYFPSIDENPTITLIKEHTLEKFYREDMPGEPLLGSIIACNTKGNPKVLAPLNIDAMHESDKPIFHPKETGMLLTAALKTQKAATYLPIVESMVTGVHTLMKLSNKKKVTDDLVDYFKPVKEELNPKKIKEIMGAEESLKKKAARLVYLFFGMQSVCLETVSPAQREKIKTRLGLD